jgi:hypothetical protein
MPRGQFEKVQDQHWLQVQLFGEDVPRFAYPQHPIDGVQMLWIASGERISYTPYHISNRVCGSLVGGVDVIRVYEGASVPFKRDWYAVVDSLNDDQFLFVDGPIKQKDNHHLIDLSQYGCRCRIEVHLVGS